MCQTDWRVGSTWQSVR